MKYTQWDRYKLIDKYLTKEEKAEIVEQVNSFSEAELGIKISNCNLKELATVLYGTDLLRLKCTGMRGRALAAIKRKEKQQNDK